MPEQPNMVVLPGSTRRALPNSRLIGKSNPEERIRISIFVRRRRHPAGPAIVSNPTAETAQAPAPPGRRAVTGEDWDHFYRANPADLEAVSQWCESNQLKVLDASLSMHRVMAEGAIDKVQHAFQIELNEYEHPKHGFFRGREGDLHIPRRLARVVTGVFGLDARRLGRSPLPRPAARPFRAATGTR